MIRHKAILLYVLLLCGIASCEKPFIPGSDDKGNLTISIMQIEQMPFAGARTRAEVSQYCTRLNFAVYDSLGTRVRQVNQQNDEENFGTADFQLAYGKYKVVVLAPSMPQRGWVA